MCFKGVLQSDTDTLTRKNEMLVQQQKNQHKSIKQAAHYLELISCWDRDMETQQSGGVDGNKAEQAWKEDFMI